MADTRAGEPWVCTACTVGGHSRCISRLLCECVHEKASWLSSVRRAALRNGAEPLDELETAFQTAYRAHCQTRKAADARRS